VRLLRAEQRQSQRAPSHFSYCPIHYRVVFCSVLPYCLVYCDPVTPTPATGPSRPSQLLAILSFRTLLVLSRTNQPPLTPPILEPILTRHPTDPRCDSIISPCTLAVLSRRACPNTACSSTAASPCPNSLSALPPTALSRRMRQPSACLAARGLPYCQ
jgi:hypothetical protein